MHYYKLQNGALLAGQHLDRRSLAIPRVPSAALAFAETLDRRADRLLAEGRTAVAEHLAHVAAEARAQAAGCAA